MQLEEIQNTAISQAIAHTRNLTTAFLNTLNPKQRQRVMLPFESDERFNGDFLPRHRLLFAILNTVKTIQRIKRILSLSKSSEGSDNDRLQKLQGLSFKEMIPEQRAAAEALLQFCLSEVGYQKAHNIMQLETVLQQIDRFPITLVRDPQQYALTIFGNPAINPWGWRLEGHHVVLHFMVITDELVAVTPAFFGVYPAEVPIGHLKGLRTLAREQDLGFQLVQSLTPQQRDRTLITTRSLDDIVTDPRRSETLREMIGLPLNEMSDAQRELAKTLLEEYVCNVRGEFAQAQLQRIDEVGLDKIHFAWAGSLEPGQARYYRLHGPTVLIEYDNTQNNANHIHTVWRDLTNDFGTDYLRKH
jgi:hypothetical protein